MQGDPRSHGLWERSAPPAPATGALADSISVDVVVIGAGFTGLSAALHLREMSVEVAILEGDEIGFGGSGRNVGLVNAGLWIRPAEVIARLGEPRGRRLLAQLGEAPALVFDLIERHGIECEAVRAGTLHCAVGEAGCRDIGLRARQWQALGAPVEALDGASTRAKVGSAVYRGSLLDRRAGTLQPLAYARGLARAALGAGARIFTRSPVTSVREEGPRWRVQTAHGSVFAEWVIVATNAYTSNVWRVLREELIALPYFNFATRPLRTEERAVILPERHGVWDTRRVLSSLRSDAAGRLVFGSIGALRGMGAAIHRDWAQRALAHLFPALAGIELEYEWYGRIGMTADAIPRFHRLARNTVSISGYNGRGIAPGTSFGRDLARLVAGRIAPADLALVESAPRPAPLRRAREAFYEVGSQLAHGLDARRGPAATRGSPRRGRR
jgi:glycine/D-amino acid oxidase-like deaminating enzyme